MRLPEFPCWPICRMRTQKPTLLVWLLTLGALLAPVTAFATINPVGQNAWTLWAFGNGNVIYNLLYAASGLVSSSGYLALVSFLSLISVVAASVMAANNAMASKRLIAAILGIFAFISIGLKETANVAVDDPVTNYINVVPNVPALVAIPPAVISEAGYRMTQLLEQYYSLPNDLTLTGGDAFDLANSLVNAQTQVQVTSPGLRATVAGFTTNCILPALASGQLNAGQLVDSTALWSMDGQQGTLAQAEQSPFTPVYTGSSPGGTLVPCGPGGVGTGSWYPTVTSTEYPSVSANNAYQYISQYFTAASPDWLANTASTFANTSTYSWLGSELTSAEQWDFGTNLTQSTGETIAQAAAVNLMNPSMRAAAVASGDSSLVTSLAVSQGQQSQISSWATAAALFRDLSGYIFSVLQAFILGIAPIILAVVVLPGAGKRILLSYGQVLIWLALWEPTMSVINFIVALYAQGTLGPTLGSSGGYSMMNQGVITQMTSNMELAAGFLASTVPLITWGLVKGGLAFTDFVVGAVGSSFATTAGAMAATGNVSLGNFSMGNETLHQRMMAARTTGGMGVTDVSVPGEGINTKFNETGFATSTPFGTNTSGTTGTTGQSVQNALAQEHRYSQQASQSANRGLAEGAAALASVMSSTSSGHTGQTGMSVGASVGASDTGTSRAVAALGAGLSHVSSEDEAKNLGYDLGAKLTVGQRKSLGNAIQSKEGAQPTGKWGAFLGGLGLSATGGLKAASSTGNDFKSSASHNAQATVETSGTRSGDLKVDSKTNAAIQAMLSHLNHNTTGLSEDTKRTISRGLSETASATNDFRQARTWATSAAVSQSVTYHRPSSFATENGVADAWRHDKNVVDKGRSNVRTAVGSHAETAAALTNLGHDMATQTGHTLEVASKGVPTAAHVRAEATAGAATIDRALSGEQQGVQKQAVETAGDARARETKYDKHTERAVNEEFRDTAKAMRHTRGAVNSADPFNLATPHGMNTPGDVTGNGLLGVGGVALLGVAKNGLVDLGKGYLAKRGLDAAKGDEGGSSTSGGDSDPALGQDATAEPFNPDAVPFNIDDVPFE